MGFPTFLSKSTQDEALANTEDFTSNWVKISAFAIVAKCKQDSKVLRNLYKHFQAPKFMIPCLFTKAYYLLHYHHLQNCKHSCSGLFSLEL